jgi:hypothetical protein
MECRLRRNVGTNAGFSNVPGYKKKKPCEELSKSIVAFRTFLALWRTGKNKELALQIVKSFEVLSVRESSSGNSVATITHTSTLTKAVTSVLTTMTRRDILCNP